MFYQLCSNYDNYNDVEYAEGTDWEAIRCPEHEDHQRAGRRIGKLKINIIGKKKRDFYWTFLSECVINDKTLNILKENNITGFNIKSVESSNNQLKLWELIVIGSGGEAHKNSGIYLKELCENCHLKIYSAFENGIIVDDNNWDGSDIFTIVGYPRYLLISEKLKSLILKYKLKGVVLIPSNNLKWPEFVIKP